MNFYTVFAIFVFLASTFNTTAEPVFRKSSEIQKNKQIIVKQTGGHDSKRSGHRSHRKPMSCVCVAEAVNASQPVKAISVPVVIIPVTGGVPIIVIPVTSSPATTAGIGTTGSTAFVPGM